MRERAKSCPASFEEEDEMTTTEMNRTEEDLRYRYYTPEDDEGNCEYKLSLTNPPPERLDHLITQLLFRLNEGDGRAIYRVGVRDDGYAEGLEEQDLDASLGTLRMMATQLGATMKKCELRPGFHGHVAEVIIVAKDDEADVKIRRRLAVIGAEGAGKSTLIGALATGAFDNGRGLARAAVLKHGHEVEADGQTSDIVERTMRADKSVALLDLAGHEKYLKTTIFGLTARFPDAALLVVDVRDAKLRRMTLEHLGVAISAEIKFKFRYSAT